MLRALDHLCFEYQLVPVREGELKAIKQKRMDMCVQEIRDSNQAEKEILLERVAIYLACQQ